MQQRNPVTVLLLSLVTFGIYSIYWSVVTGRELRAQGNEIPSSILIIVPIASLYWFFKYSEAIERVSGGKYSTVLTFLLFALTGFGGILVSQISINEAIAQPNGAAPHGGNPFISATPTNPAAPANPVAAPNPAPVATGTAVGVTAPVSEPVPQPAPAPAPIVTEQPAPVPVTPPTVETPAAVASAPVNPVQAPEAPVVEAPVITPTEPQQVFTPQEQAPTPVQSMPPITPQPQTEDQTNPNNQA